MLCNEYRRTLQTWLQYWETPYFNKSVQFVWPPFNGLKVYSHLCTTEQIYTAGILHLQVGILPRSNSRTGTDWNGPEHLSINFHGTEWTVPTRSIVHELRLLPISVANSSKIFLKSKALFHKQRVEQSWNVTCRLIFIVFYLCTFTDRGVWLHRRWVKSCYMHERQWILCWLRAHCSKP